jgi:hypothetical protein
MSIKKLRHFIKKSEASILLIEKEGIRCPVVSLLKLANCSNRDSEDTKQSEALWNQCQPWKAGSATKEKLNKPVWNNGMTWEHQFD